ncbi:hypothetical protein ACSIGC_04975 [Tenacibaculum sp. ZS6-P6]|uniref:hypothetical protein n=1 Tax=Tenacibaculum sp. ZS6-P6 TaxID=3447503 RepID=UPI003F9BE895
MEENKNKSETWLFQFVLENEKGEFIDVKKANELMSHIIEWVEKNNCQIGGAYKKPKLEDLDNIFPLDN